MNHLIYYMKVELIFQFYFYPQYFLLLLSSLQGQKIKK